MIPFGKKNCKKIFLAILLLKSLVLFGQTTAYPGKDSVLRYFLNSPDVINHFLYSKDSSVIIVDSGNCLAKARIKQFGGLPIVRQRSYLILSGSTFKGKMYFSLYNPRSNGDCSIKFFRRKKMYYVDKISCGEF